MIFYPQTGKFFFFFVFSKFFYDKGYIEKDIIASKVHLGQDAKEGSSMNKGFMDRQYTIYCRSTLLSKINLVYYYLKPKISLGWKKDF